ncbi:hypothetical protein B0T19DRAFT_449329 [Cercophora scortea]|uniref:FAD-binding PCMH-type domain-containing protein n=1 Tax=Cercophora scortea TaxID=314031 RepID=A0AAE0IZD5_9PEZI|nr:hypothetical protein B0T19DRAFT_449329 [Cercophora scortea]
MARLSSLRIFAVVSSVLGGLTGLATAVVNATETCELIRGKISTASSVIYPIQVLSYLDNTVHWFISSNQLASCVLKAGSAADVASALKIINATQTPFAVMSGGHASNPGFSSTKGVHISLAGLNQIVLSADSSTIEIGMGNHWTDVYSALDGTGVNVVGGRVPGPGVGGFTLGGGYSWKTNQFGLTCDTVKRYSIVLPNGTITQASATQNPSLFFALKGGQNRFGIVTSMVLATHPQPAIIYGGMAVYSGLDLPALLNATNLFNARNTDDKAQIITTVEGSATGTSSIVLFFYDGPTKPAIFSLFDDIVPLVWTVQSQSFNSFIQSIPAELSTLRNIRGRFATFSTTGLTETFLQAIQAEADDISAVSALHAGTTASYDIEPFTKYGRYATDSAFPHSNSALPLNLYFGWALASEDDWWIARMQQSIKTLKAVALQEGIYTTSIPVYPNYAITNTTATDLYGSKNAARLKFIRNQVDPTRVMDLAGGFVI